MLCYNATTTMFAHGLKYARVRKNIPRVWISQLLQKTTVQEAFPPSRWCTQNSSQDWSSQRSSQRNWYVTRPTIALFPLPAIISANKAVLLTGVRRLIAKWRNVSRRKVVMVSCTRSKVLLKIPMMFCPLGRLFAWFEYSVFVGTGLDW